MKNKFNLTHLLLLPLLLSLIIGCNNDDDATIEINVEDLTVTIDENPSNGETIGTMQTSGNGTPSFSIVSQTPSGALQIDGSTGEVTVANASLFDYETHPVITATVSVGGAADTATVTINLNNLSELGVQNLTVDINENPMDGDVIGTMEVNGNGTSSFSIDAQSPSGAMEIDQSTGELTVADASLFDYETNPVITATVSVVDGTGSATVTINLNNVAELDVQDLTVVIDENPADGVAIGTMQTSGNGTPSFSIDSQTPAGALAIDPSTGELTVADASLFDFETNPVITATVSVVDGIDVAMVTINLNDLAELSAQNLTVTIDENPTDGQVVGTIQVNGSGTLSFSITSQSPSGALSIDTATGELSVVDPNLFDYETNPVITATISVDNGIETATAAVTVNLNDVDEVTAQNTDMDIDENPSNGDVVGTLQATGSNLTYTITFQNPAGAFNINQSTGELSVADETVFDFETNPNMLATISVSNGVQTVSANAMVALNDLNEIGEFKFGGVIFWIDPASNNSEGLVVAASSQPNAPWGCSGTLISGADGQAIGDGASNTSAIETSCSTVGTAADIVSNLTLNGHSDWFLPSMNEAYEIYLNLADVNNGITVNGGDSIANSYWTSTQTNATIARFIGMSNGSLNSIDKGGSIQVRAVRYWTDF